MARLQHAAVFPQDGKLCDALANAVYRVFLAQTNAAQLAEINKQLDAQRRQLDWDFDQWSERISLSGSAKSSNSRSRSANSRRTSSRGKGSGEIGTDISNAGHVQRYVQRIAETEAMRVENAGKIKLTEIEAKLEFQALIMQHFMGRRFEHVIIGTRLYTEFFKDGAGGSSLKKGPISSNLSAKQSGLIRLSQHLIPWPTS